MNEVAQLLCVVVSLTGGIHCIALLRNSRKPAESSGQSVKSLPRSARRNSICARINRFCQVLLATTFLAVAGSMLAIFAYRGLSALWKENPLDQQMRWSMETVSISGAPPVIVKYDRKQPGCPVVGIDCVSKPVTDDHLRSLLAQAPKLDWLNLAFTEITDEALCESSRTPKLLGLRLDGTRIGDLRLDQLAKLKSLEVLGLAGTNITDNGLRHLADLKSLRRLYLGDTAVTDAGLEWLGSLDKLELLELWNTRVTEEGVNHLKSKLPDVVVLSSAD